MALALPLIAELFQPIHTMVEWLAGGPAPMASSGPGSATLASRPSGRSAHVVHVEYAAIAGEAKARVINELVSLTRNHPQVAAVFTAAELAATPMPAGNPQDWTIKERARASFMAERSGDVIVALNRAVTPIPEPVPGAFVATHGSVWDYDRRVPMLFWRKGMTGFEQPNPVETVDIAPTLAAVLGLKVPEGTFDGRCLDLDGGAGDTCAK